LPDLALAASADHDGFIYCNNGSCVTGNPSSAVASSGVIGGTSASTPIFAGILALLQEYQLAQSFQTTPGLGNINPTLYRLAQNVSNIFHDITIGDNIVPCMLGTPNCSTGSFGYTAGPGYDLVTGLGSVDAWSLAASWHTSQCTYALPAATTLSSHTSAFSLSVGTQSGCPWTAWTNSNWITTTPSTGTGSGNANLSLAANTTTQQRTAAVYVAGQVFTLTQNPSIAPDLLITSLTAPNTAVIGGQINATVAVSNQGSAPASAFKVEFYFSASPAISTSAVDTGSACSFTGLAAGASTQCSVPVGVPSNITPGAWYLGAIADPANQIIEQDKSNNARVADSGSITLTTIPGNQSTSLSLSRKALNFGFNASLITSTQTISVNFTGGSGASWTASSNQSNITVSPATGAGNGTLQITAGPGPSGVVTVTATGAVNRSK
jgi:hypothetical protein